MPTELRKRDWLRLVFHLPRTPATPVSQLNPGSSLSPSSGAPDPSSLLPFAPDKHSQPRAATPSSTHLSGSPVSSKQSALSPASRDLWEEARQLLPENDKEIILK